MADFKFPDFIEIDKEKVSMYDYMLRPCKSQRALHKWIKVFLNLDFPDCIVCDESTASPMSMIWNVYRAAMEGDTEEASQLYFASRDSFKTLGASIVELLMLIHVRRTACHMGAISRQSKKCYDYMRNFLQRPIINQIKQLKETMERTELDLDTPYNMHPYLQIVICTMQGANSEHTHFMCVDEVDVVSNVKAYQESKKIPTETPDKKPSITMYISTRKSAFGLVQREVDDAEKSGLKVRSWNIIDVTQACPVSKNKMDQGTVDMYFKQDALELISVDDFQKVPDTHKGDWEKKALYPGCVGCSIAPLCLGRLATKQKSTSMLLKSHFDVEKKFRSSETGDAIAQLMCLKPSTHGLVFTSFNQQKSVVSPSRMYEIFTGEKPTHVISKDELIETFQRYHVPAYAGIDWGWEAPSVCIIMFIDKKENVYIVEELAVTHTDDPEFVDIIKRRLHSRYNIQMFYPDTENPSGINLLKKAGLPVSTRKIDKSIHLGIQTMKRYIKVPGLNITKFYVLDDCKGLREELGKFHLKLDVAGQIISYDEYAEEFDHRIDATRYVVHNRLGRFGAMIDSANIPKDPASAQLVTAEGNFTKVPSASELASQLGITDFRDNREEMKKEVGKDPKDEDPGDNTGGDGSFSWSF